MREGEGRESREYDAITTRSLIDISLAIRMSGAISTIQLGIVSSLWKILQIKYLAPVLIIFFTCSCDFRFSGEVIVELCNRCKTSLFRDLHRQIRILLNYGHIMR